MVGAKTQLALWLMLGIFALIGFVTVDNAIADEIEGEKGYMLLNAEISAYCACEQCCGKSPSNKGYGVTASGEKAVEGRTIAMSSFYDFGTEVEIDGHVYSVQDRGGSITDNKIDIYFNNHEEALQFGRQQKTVKVYFMGE